MLLDLSVRLPRYRLALRLTEVTTLVLTLKKVPTLLVDNLGRHRTLSVDLRDYVRTHSLERVRMAVRGGGLTAL